jgi:flagellar hook-associated protein 1 FlgK
LEADGNTANDLRDKRNVLVDKLSGIVNIDSYEMVAGTLPNGKEDKHFIITISGKALVDHFNASRLKVIQRDEKLNGNEDVDNLYDIRWEDDNAINIRGGELKGYLDMRDGNEGDNESPDYKGIPYYIKKLNEFVRKFAMAINEGITETFDPANKYIKEYNGHADGYGLQKPGTTINPTGIRFFTMKGVSSTTYKYTELESAEFIGTASDVNAIVGKYEGLTAKNFSISGDLLNQEFAEYNIAASAGSGLSDENSNLLEILDMRHDSHLFSEGTPEDYMQSLIATLGIDSQQSIQIAKNQEIITKQVDSRRTSVSGVSIDEEMANLVRYQHAYNAAAKMVSTMSEIYNTLINRVGVGGR